MTLAPGDRLAHYSITAKLGEGGMGEVYRAADSKLGRQVAIKVLPEEFFEDDERRLRFEREARTLASLNHPGIAAVHSFEEISGPPPRHLLVMELVEGEDLTRRISSGPLPLEEALSLARQIAEALEAAHEKGIVHRDLKPANVKITPDGRVKLLDFGLAKALDPAGPSGPRTASQLTASPTLSLGATVQGVILGTAAYMSPEQAKGMAVDRRADVWAFGVVLFEMLSGKRLFEAPTVPEILARVLTLSPDLDSLPGTTPVAIRQLLRRCLDRNPRNRLHDIADARIVIEEVLSGSSGEPAAVQPGSASRRAPGWRRALPWALLVLALSGWVVSRFAAGRRGNVMAPTILPLDLGEDRLVMSVGAAVVLSPDGRRIAWVGGRQTESRILVRDLDSGVVRRLDGTEGAHDLAFSPDGRELAYFDPTSLMKVSVGGGAPQRLADVGEPRGATFTDDGYVIFNRDVSGGLWRVPAAGGTAERLTAPDEKQGERSHRWPFFVRGTHRVLFLAQNVGKRYDEGTIEMLDLVTGKRTTVYRGGSYPRVARGKLLFARDNAIWAASLDARAGRLTSPPVRVLDDVAYATLNGGAQFDVADDGTLVYSPRGASAETVQLSWYDPRSGAFEKIGGAPGPYRSPALAPDGRSLALQLNQGGRSDLWIFDIATGSRRRLTFGGRERNPVWSPDGTSIAYSYIGEGSGYRLAKVRADGVGDPVPFASSPNMRFPTSWAKSGALLITELSPQTHADIFVAWPNDPGRAPEPFLQTPANESAAVFSPDGRWVLYQSDDSGADEIYVRAFSGPGGRWQVSEGGGTKPLWSQDGRAVFYWSSQGLCRREVEAKGEAFELGRLSVTASGRSGISTEGAFAARDGRILVRRLVDEESDLQRIILVLGWGRELQRLVAGP